MAAKNYSNIAVETTLSVGIGAGDISLVVVSAVGWPASPFTLVIEPDTPNEELILVGAKSGTTFSSLTRGYGGTSAIAHNATSEIKHVVPAEDHRLIWEHVHSGAGGDDTAVVSHDNLTGVSANDHHPQAHDIASHSDTDATGPELETLTGGPASDADALHTHPAIGAGGETDLAAHVAAADPHAGYVLESALLNLMYPVGSLYFQAGVATNPSTLLGGGTWIAFAAGRVLVGFDALDTDFDVLEKTSGAKTHTHTQPTHTHTGPSHTHTQPTHTHSTPNHAHTNPNTATGGSHVHSVPNTGFESAAGTFGPGTGFTAAISHVHAVPNTNAGGDHIHGIGNTGTGGGGTSGASGNDATGASGTASTGAGGGDATGASSSLQPGIAVHIWKRTA